MSEPQIACLRCKTMIDPAVEACPHCGERVTMFQRTYATKLIDGKYQIMERLGLGGMGEIFKVRHIHLNEQRVIKIMRANIASDDQALQRFLAEARTSTMIKHPNLAMLYDFSTLDDGSYYMVWEYIEGTNIQKWIAKNGPIPPRLSLEVAIQALHGLENLHSMGLIHRDISPENIMLSSDRQGKLLVKVIDFGIAKQLSEGEGGQGLTQTGMFLGKLKYASPEQAGFIKEGEHLDARSDLYSFGVVLYEMLAGRAPFMATNPQGYILKHATEKPLPISQLNPQVKVPAKLEAEVFKSLEKDRDCRQASAADFAEALEGLRSLIPPDAKYGVGDWRGTISSQQTLVDKTGPARTLTDTTTGAPTVTGGRPERTLTDSNEPTVAETLARTSPGSPTVVERARGAEAEATVAERQISADAMPTRLEAKGGTWGTAEAEPTVLEKNLRAVAPAPARKKTGALIGIAAAVALVAGGGLWFALHRPAAPVPHPVPVPSTATATVATATTGTTELVTAPPVPAGQGEVQLLANPYGQIDKIINTDTNTPVNLASILQDPTDTSTPLRLPMPPGNYQLTVSGPDGDQKTLNVRLDPGVRKLERVTFRSPNLDSVSEDVLKP